MALSCWCAGIGLTNRERFLNFFIGRSWSWGSVEDLLSHLFFCFWGGFSGRRPWYLFSWTKWSWWWEFVTRFLQILSEFVLRRFGSLKWSVLRGQVLAWHLSTFLLCVLFSFRFLVLLQCLHDFLEPIIEAFHWTWIIYCDYVWLYTNFILYSRWIVSSRFRHN